MLAKYLDKEYKAWNRGEQTSNESMPDYFSANSFIVENLCGNRDNAFQVIETAADATVSLTGKEIVLLCDQQLFTYAIGDEICDISLDKAHPYIGKMISSHNGAETHLQTSKALREHIEDEPNGIVWMLCIVSWIVIICMSIWYLPGTGLARTLIATAGCVAILKVGRASSKKIDRIYFPHGDVLIEDYIQNVNRQCGKIDEVEIDYEEKNALSSALNTFIR